MNEVDSGRDRATPASVRHDDDEEEEGLQNSERGGQEHEQRPFRYVMRLHGARGVEG
jgi:hypothetical protein